jgi:hypothetical protein
VSGAADPLFSVEGAPSERLAEFVLQAADAALARLRARWPAPLPPVSTPLIWFDSMEALEAAAGRRVDGVLALADTARDRVLLNGPQLRQAGAGNLSRTLQHELVHLHFARAGVTQLPRWLEEGLAMRLAGERRWSDEWLLSAERLFGRVSDAEALWSHWPDSPAFEQRAYRQAASLTEFFIQETFASGGERRLLRLILDPRDGPDFIDRLWRPAYRGALYRRWLGQGGRWGAMLSFVTSPTTLFGVVCVGLLIAAYVVKRRRVRAIAAGWADQGPFFSQSPEEEDDEDAEAYEEED